VQKKKSEIEKGFLRAKPCDQGKQKKTHSGEADRDWLGLYVTSVDERVMGKKKTFRGKTKNSHVGKVRAWGSHNPFIGGDRTGGGAHKANR